MSWSHWLAGNCTCCLWLHVKLRERWSLWTFSRKRRPSVFWVNAVRMDVSSKTKLKQQLKFSYKSFPGSSQFADGSSPSGFTCGLNRNHGERIQTQLKWFTIQAVSTQGAAVFLSYWFTPAMMLICNTVGVNCLNREFKGENRQDLDLGL